jgi:hypothetical protein
MMILSASRASVAGFVRVTRAFASSSQDGLPPSGLPRARSVDQASTDNGQRSVDAPHDPYDKRHRETSGATAEEVQREVERRVAQAGGRATEALGGR